MGATILIPPGGVPVSGTYPIGATSVVSSRVTGDTNARFNIAADGTMSWGPGNATFDEVLSRNAGGNGLQSTGFLLSQSSIIAMGGAANEVRIGQTGVAGMGIATGAAAGGANVAGCTLSMGSGVPNNASGANGDIYLRTDGGVGTTIYQRRVGAWVAVI